MRREQYKKTLRLEISSSVWGNHTYFVRKKRIQKMGERAENVTGEILRGYVMNALVGHATEFQFLLYSMIHGWIGFKHVSR